MSVAAMPTASIRFNRQTRILLGKRDSAYFAAAISKPFKPNAALSRALKAARRKVRRA